MAKEKTNKKLYLFLILAILAVAIFLRFYSFTQRWSIDFDPARDATVAREALKLKKIPLIGAFSSAGPFVWGPIYYWLIMLSYLIAPNTLLAPWILFTLLDIVFVLIMIKIGEICWGQKGGLILGLIGTISTGQLFRASLVNQPTLVSLFGSLAILNFLLYAKTKKSLYLFFLGGSIGLALNMHFQALNFFLFALVIIFVEKTKWRKILINSLIFLAGVILTLSPLLYWDYTQGWKNINNVLDYFLIGQYRIWVSNRWLTYAGKFWPQLWSRVIGDHIVFGYLFIGLTAVFILYLLFTKKIHKTTLWLAIVFVIQVILNRYYRGERFEGYLVYFHPLIMFFSAFVIINLLKIKGWLGFGFLILISLFTLKADVKLIRFQKRPNNPGKIMKKFVAQLKTVRPNEKFRVYDYQYINRAPSMTASFLLSFENLIDEENGTRLGFSVLDKMPYKKLTKISGIAETVFVYDLTPHWSSKSFNQKDWINVSPQFVCLDNLEWWKVKEFKSTFSLTDYIKEKLRLK